MSHFVLKRSRTVVLTREMAEEMVAMKPSPTERALDPKRIEYLRGRAEAGLLVPFQWAKAQLGGEWLRMNGQHSSQMLCALPEELFPKDGWVHYDEYDVRTTEDLTWLFQQFDARKSVRTRVDVAGAYKGLYRELDQVDLHVAIVGIDGYAYFSREIQGRTIRGETAIFEKFGDQNTWPFLLWLPEILTVKTPELRRKEIVAAMFGTFEANEEEARRFWKEVQAGGNAIEENHPTRTLDAWYVKVREETDKQKKPKPHHYYQAAILAWNTARQGKPLQTIKPLKNDPEILA